jgi:alkyl hydroperoxide reductase subunit AhpC
VPSTHSPLLSLSPLPLPRALCPTEIHAFSDAADAFAKLNTNVIAVSTDTVHCHLAWINTPRNKGGLGPMKIPIVAGEQEEE